MTEDMVEAIRIGRELSDRLSAANVSLANTDGGGRADSTNLVAAGILLALANIVDAICDVATDELARGRGRS